MKQIPEDMIHELMSLKQRGTVTEFREEFDMVINRLELSEEDALSYFMEGLKKETNMMVRIFNPATVERASYLAKLYESAYSNSNPANVYTKAIKGQEDHTVRAKGTGSHTTDRVLSKFSSSYLNPQLLQERRSRGLCDFCDQPYTAEHNVSHKKLQIQVIEMEETDEDDPEKQECILEMPTQVFDKENLANQPCMKLKEPTILVMANHIEMKNNMLLANLQVANREGEEYQIGIPFLLAESESILLQQCPTCIVEVLKESLECSMWPELAGATGSQSSTVHGPLKLYTIISDYCECGRNKFSHQLLDKMMNMNDVPYNTLISNVDCNNDYSSKVFDRGRGLTLLASCSTHCWQVGVKSKWVATQETHGNEGLQMFGEMSQRYMGVLRCILYAIGWRNHFAKRMLEIGNEFNEPLMSPDPCNYWISPDAQGEHKEASILSYYMQLDADSIGIFLGGLKLKSSRWCCMYDEQEVSAEVLGTSVNRSQVTLHIPGRVPFNITCGNRLACSEVCEFEYHENAAGVELSLTLRNESEEEFHLQVRFASMLSLDVDRKALFCSTEGCLKCKIKGSSHSLLDEDGSKWDKMEKDSKVAREYYLIHRDALLQKRLKNVWYECLLCKVHEEIKGPKELDEEGQGVIHLADALSYECAMSHIVSSRISPSFRNILGRTALHCAAYSGRNKTVVALVCLGAVLSIVEDPTSKFPEESAAVDLASHRRHKGIAGYLAEAALNSHLSSLTLTENVVDTASATLVAEKAVEYVQGQTTISFNEKKEDQLSLGGSLAAVRNSAQVAARIQAAFRFISFHQRHSNKGSEGKNEDHGDDLQETSMGSTISKNWQQMDDYAVSSTSQLRKEWPQEALTNTLEDLCAENEYKEKCLLILIHVYESMAKDTIKSLVTMLTDWTGKNFSGIGNAGDSLFEELKRDSENQEIAILDKGISSDDKQAWINAERWELDMVEADPSKGSRNRRNSDIWGMKSMMHIKPCGLGYWIITLFQVSLAIGFASYIFCYDYQRGHQQAHSLGNLKEGVASTRSKAPQVAVSFASLESGIRGGLVGNCGGLLINPVLLQIGIPPQKTATTTSMIYFSPSMSAVQYTTRNERHY